MGTFLGLLIAVAIIIFISYPLFMRIERQYKPGGKNADKLDKLRARLEADSAQLRQIEQDFKSGSISEEDYHDMESRYRAKVEAAQKDLNLRHKRTAIDQEIEREVKKLRHHKQTR